MDAAQDNDLGVSLGCLTGEGQRVASEIRDPVEDLRRLVVVSQNDGVALTFELVNRRYIWSVNGPFDLRDDPPDALKYGRGCPSDLRRIVEPRWRPHYSVSVSQFQNRAPGPSWDAMVFVSAIGVKSVFEDLRIFEAAD